MSEPSEMIAAFVEWQESPNCPIDFDGFVDLSPGNIAAVAWHAAWLARARSGDGDTLRPARGPTFDQIKAAAEMLASYARFIGEECHSSDLERWHYFPEVEQLAEEFKEYGEEQALSATPARGAGDAP